MKPAVEAAFVPFTAPLEGVVPYMYLDVKGLVTVAIGNLIDPIQYAMPLPFVHKSDGRPATMDEIAAEWLAVKRHPNLAAWGHRPADALTSLRLTEDGIRLVVSRKLRQNVDHLRRRFAEWDSWPADAQLATLSMAWACGPAFRFPLLEAALKAKDFELASVECRMNVAGNPGLAPRNEANRALYRNAARVLALRLDPDEVHYPADLSKLVAEAETQPDVPNPASSPTICVEAPEEFPIVRVSPSSYMRPKEWLDGVVIEVHDDDGED